MWGKTFSGYLPVSIGVTLAVDPDFHGFLPHSCSAMWIRLESHALLGETSSLSHAHQMSVLFVHSLWTDHRRYSSLLAQYPQLAQASTTATVFI
jgi:hypothetical protein